MAKYAAATEVPVEKSKAEIEKTVQRYGADGFMSAWADNLATVKFRCKERVVRMTMRLPRADEKRFTQWRRTPKSAWEARSPEAARKLWEQACRQKWRALALLVKAKLEAVDAGIATFEEAFLANVVDPRTGKTVYETIQEPLRIAYEKGGDFPLLGREA